MRLNELIAQLEAATPTLIVARGFSTPHSDRGDYANLAFTPAENVTVASMLLNARHALGKTFQGYKGGDYEMCGDTEVYLGEYGECGEPLSAVTIDAMLTLAAKDAMIAELRAYVQGQEARRLNVAMPDGRTALAVNEVVQEMLEATQEHGELASPHEGLGVLLEEFEELKDWVKLKERKRDPLDGRREAKQVAAVAIRFMLDCCEPKEKGGMITKPVAAIIGESGCARAVCVLLIGLVLTVSGCAAPAKSYLTVTDPAGKEVLQVQENGKMLWKAKRDEVARVMIQLIFQRDEMLKKLEKTLATCNPPAPKAAAKSKAKK